MIFFCWASLEKKISLAGGGGGFTCSVDQYVEASDRGVACAAYQEYLEKKGIRVLRVTASISIQQDKSKYTFPENILVARPQNARASFTAEPVRAGFWLSTDGQQ
jgi:hypothetical protein